MGKLRGQCCCRAMTYEVEDDFAYAFNCHCSNCRRASGAAFRPIAGLPVGKLAITDGAGRAMRLGGDDNHDVHCRDCGSLLYSVIRDGAYAHVSMGTLLDTSSIRPAAHIFVGSKAPWFKITDDLPQHTEWGWARDHCTRAQAFPSCRPGRRRGA